MNSTNLSLRPDNPYANGAIFVHDDGELNLDLPDLEYTPSINDRYFTLVDGDDLSSVSYLAYNNSKWYWAIARVNGLINPLDVSSGDTLIIPDLNNVKAP